MKTMQEWLDAIQAVGFPIALCIGLIISGVKRENAHTEQIKTLVGAFETQNEKWRETITQINTTLILINEKLKEMKDV